MISLTSTLAILLSLGMVISAFIAISEKRSIAITILAAGLVSLLASVMFLLLAAPDVAMTEAAIGSGLTTFLFFFVLAKVRGGQDD